MFKDLRQTIHELNADVSNVTNCEKAKKLRKRLLAIGLPMAIIGFIGVFVGVGLLVSAGFADLEEFSSRIMLPFLLIVPCAVIAFFGLTITSLGLKIVITGYTTNLINETVGKVCPTCGATLNSEMEFCAKCGTKVKKECANCHHVNSHTNEFCEKCGNKLN